MEILKQHQCKFADLTEKKLLWHRATYWRSYGFSGCIKKYYRKWSEVLNSLTKYVDYHPKLSAAEARSQFWEPLSWEKVGCSHLGEPGCPVAQEKIKAVVPHPSLAWLQSLEVFGICRARQHIPLGGEEATVTELSLISWLFPVWLNQKD